MAIHSLWSWLRLRDFDDAIQRARLNVMKRYARGNVTFQNGYVLDDAALDELRSEGDSAVSELNEQQQASTHATRS